jgi:D-alanyl-D-alanine dipeptidase
MDSRKLKAIRIMKYLIVLAVAQVSFTAQSQNIKVISKSTIYRQQVLADSNNRMVELRTVMPNLVYDLRYATRKNFTGKKLYKNGQHTYLRQPVATALAQVQAFLAPDDLGLKVFDAYRPYSVTKKMWDLIGDERYVANPASGSGHNRGTSVDVTLIQLSTGREIDMGTGFDHFSDTAHHSFMQLPAQGLHYRSKLKAIMEQNGFNALETEWWHYSWKSASRFELLDLSFLELKMGSNKAGKK